MSSKSIIYNFPHRIDDFSPIFAEFKELTSAFNCVSFGEGAPGYNPPDFLKQELMRAVEEGFNQYTRPIGHPILVNKIAEVYGKKLGREINPMTEIMASNGANNALNLLMNGLVNAGEEIACFEPLFPPYLEHAQLPQAKFVGVPLSFKDGEISFDPERLRKALNKNTKLFILNNAHNPTGKLFSKNELLEISRILDEFPHIIVISDEVYDFLSYDDNEHHYFATIGNNYEKTISTFSGGKLFCATGWKIGWAIGPHKFLKNPSILMNTILYTFNAPGQIAIARALDKLHAPSYQSGLSYYEYQRKEFQNVRDYMYNEMISHHIDIPIKPIKPQSGYFMTADISECKDVIPDRYLNSHDYIQDPYYRSKVTCINQIYTKEGKIPIDLAFSRWLAVEKGVIVMPCSLFYHKDSPHKSDHFVRIAICRGMQNSKNGIEKLKQQIVKNARKVI